MFGFSVGIVTSVAAYILNERPIMIASCVLTFTTGCALIGMKDLPYLKSLEENSQIILKRVKKIRGLVTTLKQTNASLTERISKISEATKKYEETTSKSIESKRKFGKELQGSSAELSKALDEMKKLQNENEKLQKQLRETEKQLEDSRNSYNSFKKHQQGLATTTEKLSEITFAAERTATALKTGNLSLENNVQQASKLLEEGKAQTVTLQAAIQQSDKTLTAHFDISRKADEETQAAMNDTKKAIKNVEDVLIKANQVLLRKQNKSKEKNATNLHS